MRIANIEIDETRPLTLHAAHGVVKAAMLGLRYDPVTNPAGMIGQKEMLDFLLIAVLTGNHVLNEGNPGLGKTESCKRVASAFNVKFNRVQFVPDMMPSDLLGSQRFVDIGGGRFAPQFLDGPIFCNLFLADEINRASAKVQAALLEATGELQVSILGQTTKPLRHAGEAEALYEYLSKLSTGDAKPFFKHDPKRFSTRWPLAFSTLATMNPLELEGTYLLSEAQLDRFMAKVLVPYPTLDEMRQLQFHHGRSGGKTQPQTWEEALEKVKGTSEQKVDLAVIFFLSELRELLVGDAARDRILKANPDFTRWVRWLTNFSHLRPFGGGADESGGWSAETGDAAASVHARSARLDLRKWGRGEVVTDEGEPTERTAFADHLLRSLAGDSYPTVISGASPRGQMRLTEAAIVHAYLRKGADSSGIVMPEWQDLKAIAKPVLRHRIRLSSSATAMHRSSDEVITILLEAIEASIES